ncbi:unnamed protein product [Diamesa serratosioi]
MYVKSFLCFVLFCAKECTSSKILVLFPSTSRSHLVVAQGVTTALAERGHQVTVVSPFPLDKPMRNYRDIKLELDDFHKEFMLHILKDPGNTRNMFKQMPAMLKVVKDMGNNTIHMPEMQLMMKNEKFDLIIVGFFMNNHLLGLAEHFNCPSIMISSIGPMSFTNQLFGNPAAVSGTRHMSLQSTELNFIGRIKNLLIHIPELLMIEYMNYIQKNLYDANFPADKYMSHSNAVKNLSLILVNSHVSQGNVRPNVPAVIEIGGIQVKSTPSPLPDNIQKWLDESTNGVVFFSLGSNAKSTYLSKEQLAILLNVFSKLKQRVIMKWEADVLDGKPDNVLIGKWLPQDDILAHPNVKLFISHCGLGGVVESQSHGVPIVGMPLFGDQMGNLDAILAEGWAVKVDFATITEDNLMTAVQEVLQNPKYTNKVKYLADLYLDRPMSAKDTAIYWVEYVIKHKGAKHLRYAGADLNFLQYNSIDVIAFLIILIYVVCVLIAKFFKFLYRRLFKRKTINKSIAKKNA